MDGVDGRQLGSSQQHSLMLLHMQNGMRVCCSSSAGRPSTPVFHLVSLSPSIAFELRMEDGWMRRSHCRTSCTHLSEAALPCCQAPCACCWSHSVLGCVSILFHVPCWLLEQYNCPALALSLLQTTQATSIQRGVVLDKASALSDVWRPPTRSSLCNLSLNPNLNLLVLSCPVLSVSVACFWTGLLREDCSKRE